VPLCAFNKIDLLIKKIKKKLALHFHVLSSTVPVFFNYKMYLFNRKSNIFFIVTHFLVTFLLTNCIACSHVGFYHPFVFFKVFVDSEI
jgi:hypothetical protein